MANTQTLGNSNMGYLKDHVAVPISLPATTYSLKIKSMTPLHILHLLMTTPYTKTSNQETRWKNIKPRQTWRKHSHN